MAAKQAAGSTAQEGGSHKKFDLVDVAHLIHDLDSFRDKESSQMLANLPVFMKDQKLAEGFISIGKVLSLSTAKGERHYIIVHYDWTETVGRVYVCETGAYLIQRKKTT